MLPVEPVVDQLAWIDLVDDPVSIVLGRCREDHDLVAELVHPLKELVHSRPDVVVSHTVVLKVMHECLVQVKHQGEDVRGRGRRQLGVLLEVGQHGGQGLEPDDGAVLRKLLRAVAQIRILHGPRAVRVRPVHVEKGPKAHVLQHLGPDHAGFQAVQGHTPSGQHVVYGRENTGLGAALSVRRGADAPADAGTAVSWRRGRASAAQRRPLRGGAAAELADDVDDHLVVLPERHDVLAAAKAAVALHTHEDVEVQILRAMSRHVGLLPVILVLEHPPLAHHVQQNQAILMDVVQEVAQAGPDRHGDSLHDA
mmetsp:Transcript_17688/g.44777  ORF Transcript_17688/g.44777 Transcript_17688/m.44777 type:complete len:310 (+) Transcript_17688:392-1321(+)